MRARLAVSLDIIIMLEFYTFLTFKKGDSLSKVCTLGITFESGKLI